MRIVDPHVHCRDGKQGYKDSIGRVLYHAGVAGVGLIMDMPNTDPAIISRKLVRERLALASLTKADGVTYGLHIGLTSDPAQIREAVDCYNEFRLREKNGVGVAGLKMYTGESIGDLAITNEDDQRMVYGMLGKCNYRGVLVNHCEKKKFMRPDLWNPDKPLTHSLARPAKAELESITDQVGFLYDSGFKGTLHIAHVSTPEAVDYICNVRNNEVKNMKITCGATPHHLFLNYQDAEEFSADEKMGLKVNPPLRTRPQQMGLLDCLRMGKIDWIETDHANHGIKEKFIENYLSGIPGITSWPRVVERLKEEGIVDKRIEELIGGNALKTYGLPESVVGDVDVEADGRFGNYEYGYGGLI